MEIIPIQVALDCALSNSFFVISGGEPFCGEWVFHCVVEVRLEDKAADLWRHTFNANIYKHGHGSYVPNGPDVWSRSAVAYVTGDVLAFDLNKAIRPFLFECVVDAFVAGYHIVGSYDHDGRSWGLLGPVPDAVELPDLT